MTCACDKEMAGSLGDGADEGLRFDTTMPLTELRAILESQDFELEPILDGLDDQTVEAFLVVASELLPAGVPIVIDEVLDEQGPTGFVGISPPELVRELRGLRVSTPAAVAAGTLMLGMTVGVVLLSKSR